MKGFSRNYPQIALCGLNCLLCPMNLGNYCPGCGGGDGNQGCPRARCARDRGISDFCFRCDQYPCQQYEGIQDYDTFVPTVRIQADLERLQTIGIEDYVRELQEKREILDDLLCHWNDGRRKSFYSVAVYLMGLEDLRRIVDSAKQNIPSSAPVRERAVQMAERLQQAARQQKLMLKLRKKKKVESE